MKTSDNSKKLRIKRLPRIRKKIVGKTQKPRIAVIRSNKYLKAQVIDDVDHTVIAAIGVDGKNSKKAIELGQKIIEVAKNKKIKEFVFDRSGYRYHGVIKIIAETVKEGGVKI